MEIRTVNIDDMEVRFVCESADTRHGFKHVVHMFVDNFEEECNTAYYLNRTWESYRYQTAMLGCVSKAKENRIEILKSNFKSENEISRMTAKRNAEFGEVLKADWKYKFYEELYSKVSLGQIN